MQKRSPSTEVYQRFTLSLDVVVRTCAEDDLPHLEWFGMFAADREIIHTTWQQHLRGEQLMLVAAVRSFPAGQVWIDLATKRSERVGWLWAVRVIPCLQRLGIGRRLMHSAEQALVRRGFAAAELAVDQDAPAAGAFYERLGYRLAGAFQQPFTRTTSTGATAEFAVGQLVYRKHLQAL